MYKSIVSGFGCSVWVLSCCCTVLIGIKLEGLVFQVWCCRARGVGFGFSASGSGA